MPRGNENCRRCSTNEGYALTELPGAAELDLQWHLLPPDAAAECRYIRAGGAGGD